MRIPTDTARLKRYLCRKKTCKVCGKTAPVAGWHNCGGCPYCLDAAREKTLTARSGCPSCDGSGKTLLLWKEFSKGSGLPAKYRQYLLRKKKLRCGTLYECSRCHAPWFLDERAQDLRPVPKSRLRLFRKWCGHSQSLPRALLKKALGIGAVRYDDFWYVPCRVKLRNGVRLDRCVISFQNGPPLDDWRRNLRLAAEIADIMPSPRALPLPVRKASADSWDAPYGGTLACTPDRQYLHIQVGAQFAELAGIAPGSLRLEKRPTAIPPKARIRQVANRQSQITYFVADQVKFDTA